MYVANNWLANEPQAIFEQLGSFFLVSGLIIAWLFISLWLNLSADWPVENIKIKIAFSVFFIYFRPIETVPNTPQNGA